jgi:hypothetical protein
MGWTIGAKLLSAMAAIVAAAPAPAQDAVPPPDSPAPSCADLPRLEAERSAVRTEITRIAMGGIDRRDRKRGAAAGKMAAGTAAGLLLPFGIGLALKGTTMLAEAAAKKEKARHPAPPPPPGPDVPALIERQHALDVEIAALESCPARAPPAPSKRG